MKLSFRKPIHASMAIVAFTLLLTELTSCGESKTTNQEPSSEDTLQKRAAGIFAPITGVPENQENPMSDAKILLGKTLFHDVRLSKNNSQSCNTCHSVNTYGVDNLPTSPGDLGEKGTRNSPTVFNAAFHFKQFWDGRAADVEEQAGMPIGNPVEMNMPDEDFVITRLRNIEGYHKLFADAFPDDKNPIQFSNLTKAIGAFERTLITPSRFDQYLLGDSNALSTEEKKGLSAFIDAGCVTCHMGVVLGGNIMQKFPLYGTSYQEHTSSAMDDKGLMEVTGEEKDRHMFKVPSLRNIAKTAPYFHDGSVAELNDAVRIMGKLQLDRELSKDEITSISIFLNALTGEITQDAKSIPDMPQ